MKASFCLIALVNEGLCVSSDQQQSKLHIDRLHYLHMPHLTRSNQQELKDYKASGYLNSEGQ